ncbi:MAG: hypothetical protein UEP57_00175 [Oscillospiraceae bacterium]|nr:hypothetical protein [Oscillospiraceae bacterium]
MKQHKKYRHLKIYKPEQPIYPNAAGRSYYQAKAVDVITAIVSVMGFVSAMLFLVTMA